MGANPAAQRPVVIVDDSEDDQFFAIRLLRRAGVTAIVTFTRANEAMAFLRAARRSGRLPLLVFCDVKMDEHDGFEVLKWVRSQRRLTRLPFYILSGADDEGDRHRAIELGADGYFAKFPDPDIITSLISRYT